MRSISNVLGGSGMVILALWWYYRYRSAHPQSPSDLWQASRVMSVIAVVMFFWVALLVWGLK